MSAEPKLAIGDQVPPFQLETIEGEVFESSSFAGQDLLLFMWASW